MDTKKETLERRKFLGLLGLSTGLFLLPKKIEASTKELDFLLGHSVDAIPQKIITSLDNKDIEISRSEKRLADLLLNRNLVKFSTKENANEKKLFMYNIHTGEFFNEVFWADGKYIKENLYKLNYFMRDFRANKVKRIDLKAIEAIYMVSKHTKRGRPLILNSAYRTRRTNALVGGAKKSNHKLGKAIDFSLDKKDHTSLFALKRYLIGHHNGGVGYYPSQGFIHVDSGKKRYWRG